jgi:hypothetical protein
MRRWEALGSRCAQERTTRWCPFWFPPPAAQAPHARAGSARRAPRRRRRPSIRPTTGIERGAAGRHPRHPSVNASISPHALLQQITHPLGTIADQVARIPLVVVLRQHKHTSPRQPPAQLHRSPQTVIAKPRRHPNVHNRHIRPMRKRLAKKIPRITACATTSKPADTRIRAIRGGRWRMRELTHSPASGANAAI